MNITSYFDDIYFGTLILSLCHTIKADIHIQTVFILSKDISVTIHWQPFISRLNDDHRLKRAKGSLFHLPDCNRESEGIWLPRLSLFSTTMGLQGSKSGCTHSVGLNKVTFRHGHHHHGLQNGVFS